MAGVKVYMQYGPRDCLLKGSGCRHQLLRCMVGVALHERPWRPRKRGGGDARLRQSIRAHHRLTFLPLHVIAPVPVQPLGFGGAQQAGRILASVAAAAAKLGLRGGRRVRNGGGMCWSRCVRRHARDSKRGGAGAGRQQECALESGSGAQGWYISQPQPTWQASQAMNSLLLQQAAGGMRTAGRTSQGKKTTRERLQRRPAHLMDAVSLGGRNSGAEKQKLKSRTSVGLSDGRWSDRDQRSALTGRGATCAEHLTTC